MANIFISYSSEDKTIVQQLASLLESKGWSVWWDRQIPIGKSYDTVIEDELTKADCVLVIWTKRSVASKWVKSEANEALQKEKLIPILLEQVEPPLAFRMIESALLINWNGKSDHPELELLFESVKRVISGETLPSPPPPDDNPNPEIKPDHQKGTGNGSSTFGTGDGKNSGTGTGGTGDGGVVISFAGLFKKYRTIVVSLLCLLLGVLIYFMVILHKPVNETITIRVFDWKRNAVKQGEVKLYLKEYIRSQSIDNTGQALFTGIPEDMFAFPVKIEIRSPGYAMKSIDTLLKDARQLEFTLPLNEVIFISGKIKTASEMPIKGVEVNVDGTRYFDKSKTDGSYKIRLEEYTLGDEITITTSHEGYEDKTISVLINSPDITNQDIFLQPVHP